MTSQARIAANRRNAEKSTGPRTPEGKAIVAQNAVKHGLWARAAVLKDEDPQEFEQHRSRMLQELAPQGPQEEALAERIIGLWWRLKRAERMQDESLDYLIEADRASDWVKLRQSGGDPSAAVELTFGRAVAKDFANARTLDRLSMHERRIESSLYRTMNELDRLKRNRTPGSPVETQYLASAQPITVNDPCGAKQSQSSAEASSLKCDVSREAELAPKDGPSCETKPIEAAGSVCNVPARASRSTGILPVILGPGRDAHATATPCGVTTNEAERAKQSQRGASAARVGVPLRARPRVAYHEHAIARSY